MTVSKRQKRKKYAKIPKKYKILFLKKVFQQNQALKTAADLFKINYSTAKTLIRQFKNQSFDLDLTECENHDSKLFPEKGEGLKRCNYKQVASIRNPIQMSFMPQGDRENVEKRIKHEIKNSYVLIWPQIQEKTRRIQIVSKIQF